MSGAGMVKWGLIAVPVCGIVLGLGLQVAGLGAAARWVFGAATLPVLGALAGQIVSGLRRGDLGLDLAAALSMSAALVFGEELAAAVVALMYAGGQRLEDFAAQRATREMTALLSRMPKSALRYEGDGMVEVPVEALEPGDRILVRRGEVASVDGQVGDSQTGGRRGAAVAVLDLSALTGESLPVRRRAGEAVTSGATNVGDAFDLIATRRAADSTYAGIVRLVNAAKASKAPMARLADRFALGFLGFAVTLAAAAALATGDPIRAVAVLVAATPCPLILAVPVALVAGLSKAARHGALVKGSRALEQLASIACVVLDKTGTLTDGRARLIAVEQAQGGQPDEAVRLAASLDQASAHVVARTLVEEARTRGLALSTPIEVSETPGEGLEGRVDGHAVVVGGTSYVAARLGHGTLGGAARRRDAGAMVVTVAVDGRFAADLVLADQLRPEARDFIRALRAQGIARIVLATGDRREVAEAVAQGLGLDAVQAGLTPDRKIIAVLAERKHGAVMMVGDGVNDAPALAAADIGLAMGARGAAAAAEVADVVLLVDQLDQVPLVLAIARRSRRIALESVVVGIGLSAAAMLAAAFGLLAPVQGALVQEVIDVAVVLNALRALR